jgi:hypothetical protein
MVIRRVANGKIDTLPATSSGVTIHLKPVDLEASRVLGLPCGARPADVWDTTSVALWRASDNLRDDARGVPEAGVACPSAVIGKTRAFRRRCARLLGDRISRGPSVHLPLTHV